MSHQRNADQGAGSRPNPSALTGRPPGAAPAAAAAATAPAARSHWPPPVAQAVRFFETITPESAATLADLYAPDARFRDPFNEVRGTVAIARVFTHMFEQVHEPRFEVIDAIVGADEVFLTWDFVFRLRVGATRPLRRIHGSSHLRFDADGRIAYHRDYWDAAELYSLLPGIGALMRWLRGRVAVPAT